MLPAFVLVLTFIGLAPLLRFLDRLIGPHPSFWSCGETSKLGSPHCVAGLRVGLDFHRNGSCPEIFIRSIGPLVVVLDLARERSNHPPHSALPAFVLVLTFIGMAPVLRFLFRSIGPLVVVSDLAGERSNHPPHSALPAFVLVLTFIVMAPVLRFLFVRSAPWWSS